VEEEGGGGAGASGAPPSLEEREGGMMIGDDRGCTPEVEEEGMPVKGIVACVEREVELGLVAPEEDRDVKGGREGGGKMELARKLPEPEPGGGGGGGGRVV
jgi:hypothetical protein